MCNRADKRGIVASAAEWRELRELRHAIEHDYLIESAGRVLKDALIQAPKLMDAVGKLDAYVAATRTWRSMIRNP